MAIVTCPLGTIEGTDFDGYQRYAGIRYAQAPVGPLRFRAPVPVEPWEGTYDATAFGAAAPQPASVLSFMRRPEQPTDEDCLFLNVYTPAADGGRRPVMVWIHGGAFTMGSGDFYDGASFCRAGDVVVVTLNYRLGALGWLPLEHLDPSYAGSANNGIRDQIEALRWVAANIEAFGGDPGNVTIFGESAGGGSVSAVLAAPEADALYHRAIIESGVPGFAEVRSPELAIGRILAALAAPGDAAGAGPATGVEALLGAPADALVAAQAAVSVFADGEGLFDGAHTLRGSGVGFHPVVDGVVVTRTPAEAVADRRDHNVPLLIGTNLDEGTLFATLLPASITESDLESALGEVCADPAVLVAAYKEKATGRPLVVDMFTDSIFRMPSLAVADAQAATEVPVWVYLFTWATPAFGGQLGSTHALELPFVWGAVGDPAWQLFLGDAPPAGLAASMQAAWLAFARTGDPACAELPAWPRYEAGTRPTMIFDAEVRLAHDPEAAIRKAWAPA